MAFDFKLWMKQTSTIQGFQVIAGTVVASAGAYAEGHHALAVAMLATGVAGGAVGLILPDNTQAAADTREAVGKFVSDVQAKDQQRAMADALNGAVKVLSDIAVKIQPAPVAVTVSNAVPNPVAPTP